MDKKPKSIRLTGEADRLLRLIAQSKGISQTAVIEIMVREYAKKEGIT